MRNALLAAVAAVTLLAGCRQSPRTSGQQCRRQRVARCFPITDDNPAVPVRTREQGAQALKLMHERHEGMEEIGKAFKAARPRDQGRARPTWRAVRSSAATIAGFAPKVAGLVPGRHRPDVGKTRAKAEIWQKPEDFAAKAKAFQAARAERSTRPPRPATSPRSRPASATSARPARRATTAIAAEASRSERAPVEGSRSGTCRSGCSTGCWRR